MVALTEIFSGKGIFSLSSHLQHQQAILCGVSFLMINSLVETRHCAFRLSGCYGEQLPFEGIWYFVEYMRKYRQSLHQSIWLRRGRCKLRDFEILFPVSCEKKAYNIWRLLKKLKCTTLDIHALSYVNFTVICCFLWYVFVMSYAPPGVRPLSKHCSEITSLCEIQWTYISDDVASSCVTSLT